MKHSDTSTSHRLPASASQIDDAQSPVLAELIGSRICHDLISPIGAIGNGVELLMMEGASKSPEMALIAESVANANARIRFFRVGLGISSSDQRIARTEVLSILSDLTRGGRLSIDWQGPSDLSRAEVKLAFLGIMVLETAMAFGGRITVVQDGGAWTLTGEAARLRVDPALWAMLSDPADSLVALTPAQIQFALLPQAADRAGRRVVVTVADTLLRLTF
jgi:histidine phosphotransferase ChpT